MARRASVRRLRPYCICDVWGIDSPETHETEIVCRDCGAWVGGRVEWVTRDKAAIWYDSEPPESPLHLLVPD